ncbi:hypothetical protein BV22DRAFT_1122042 [Leucogyrophana mollusca]|uniref:Uncharacterized protein n=1 Tax=Leucogyrophana mollusca TaxID=85980 RepID=A0ACB8B8H1_9AGAM|nr:hypothetical protein BV22DRAFT_1122042 [Leucogyrophana mollusca]
MRVGDFSASVVVDGVELEEYGVTHAVPRGGNQTVTCWIASEEGKKFAIRWKCWSRIRKDACSGKVSVDGNPCRGTNILPGPLGRGDTAERSYISDDTTTREFLFSRLQLTDDDVYLDQPPSEKIGEIALVLQRGQLVKARRRHRKLDLPVDDKVHERSKKATAHRISFGEAVSRPASASQFKLMPGNLPPIIFVFKYRPLDVLQANGIAPPKMVPGVKSNDNDEIEILEGSYVAKRGVNIATGKLENKTKPLHSQHTSPSLNEDRKPKRIKMEASELQSRNLFASGESQNLAVALVGRLSHSLSHNVFALGAIAACVWTHQCHRELPVHYFLVMTHQSPQRILNQVVDVISFPPRGCRSLSLGLRLADSTPPQAGIMGPDLVAAMPHSGLIGDLDCNNTLLSTYLPMKLGDFSAWVVVDGIEVDEYDVTAVCSSANENKITCWITSEEGKAFTIKWKCWSAIREDDALGQVYVDGTYCEGKRIERGRLGLRGDTAEFSNVSESDTDSRELVFTALELTDDDAYLERPPPEELGTISVEIMLGRAVKWTGEPPKHIPPDNDKVHETLKKSRAHRIGLGKVVKTRTIMKGFVPHELPATIFMFKYRPLDVLQARGIVPQNVINRPIKCKGGDDATSEEDSHVVDEELKAKIRELEASYLKTRKDLKRLYAQQASSSNNPDTKRIKSEALRTPKRNIFAPGEIIDLT